MKLFSKRFHGRFVLRDLPLPSRLVVASFLVCVGIGYFGALLQLHFHHASPGKLLPDTEDVAGIYHGRNGMSQLERLLVGDEGKPFNGGGTMRQAFSSRSSGWKTAINRRSKEKSVSLQKAEAELRSERDGERLVLLAWIKAGADKQEFEHNAFVVPANLTKHPITKDMLDPSSDGTVRAKIGTIVESRCVRCHQESAGGPAAQIPLDTWEEIHAYCEVKTAAGGVSAKKLTQTTHVHLLGFAFLYGLTGEFLTLLGPSGCGKSTVLRLIAGLTQPSSGSIHWPDGRLEIGFVFQEPTLMPWTSVFNNVWLPLRLGGMSKTEAAPKIEAALDLVGLSAFAHAFPRELSGGMKMRVSIARAVMLRPPLLLMDEPFAALDEITRFKLNNDLLRLKRELGTTVVFVTHSVYESVYLSTRIAVFAQRPGRVAEEIEVPASLRRDEDFRLGRVYADCCRKASHALQSAMD